MRPLSFGHSVHDNKRTFSKSNPSSALSPSGCIGTMICICIGNNTEFLHSIQFLICPFSSRLRNLSRFHVESRWSRCEDCVLDQIRLAISSLLSANAFRLSSMTSINFRLLSSLARGSVILSSIKAFCSFSLCFLKVFFRSSILLKGSHYDHWFLIIRGLFFEFNNLWVTKIFQRLLIRLRSITVIDTMIKSFSDNCSIVKLHRWDLRNSPPMRISTGKPLTTPNWWLSSLSQTLILKSASSKEEVTYQTRELE